MDISRTFKSFGFLIKRHSPEILTGIGIAGMISTTVMAVKATPKALLLIEEEKRTEHTEKLGTVETVKVVWKCYIPAVVTGTVSTVCLIGASSVSLKRNAALAAACSLSETALKEYKSKVIETIGEKKEKTVRDAVAKEAVEKNPVVNNEVIITEKGETLCYDIISGRYFKSDIEKIRRTENELNKQMLDDGYVSLNDLYFELGLDCIPLGDGLGWNINNGYMELYFSSQLTHNDTPCVVINYGNRPQYGFNRLMI